MKIDRMDSVEIDRVEGVELERDGRELGSLDVGQDPSAWSDEELEARFREALAFGRERGQRQLELVDVWLERFEESFDSACFADLECGQRLAWMRRLGSLVRTLVLSLQDERASSEAEACAYQGVLDELGALEDFTLEERLRDRLRQLSAERGWKTLDDLDLYDDARRAIDVRGVGEAYGWTPPREVLELLFESSLAALRGSGGAGRFPRAG